MIRTQQELDDFVATIPATVPRFTDQPAPNEDALRDSDPIDFSTDMLVVCTRGSMFVDPEITRIAIEGDTLVVEVTYPPLGDTTTFQAILDMGRYHAAVVPRSDLDPEFRETIEDE